MIERLRKTLAAPSKTLTGVGLHSGADASVCFLPALPGTGLTFRSRVTGQEIPAQVANVTDTSRCTRLGANGLEIQTVEHALSALAGLGVDDAVIQIEGPELPAADGSAAPFAALIQEAGLCGQPETEVVPLLLSHAVTVTEGNSAVVALPSDRFEVSVVLNYPQHPYLGTLASLFSGSESEFLTQIAPARTYGFLSEIEALRARGLGLGASRENALVLGEDRFETAPRFPNEMARHKLLDLIGDLALLGRPLCAQIIAVRPSHALNTRLARALAETQA